MASDFRQLESSPPPPPLWEYQISHWDI